MVPSKTVSAMEKPKYDLPTAKLRDCQSKIVNPLAKRVRKDIIQNCLTLLILSASRKNMDC